MSNMSEDYREVTTARTDGPITAQKLHRVWEGRLPRLGEYGLKSEAQRFSVWLKAQASRSSNDATWEDGMRQAGLLHSPQALGGAATLASVDMIKLVRSNISMMVDQVPGLKALIVDETTLGILAASITSTSLAEQAVVVGPEIFCLCAPYDSKQSCASNHTGTPDGG